LSIAFTYSRASFLSLFAGGIAVIFLEKSIKKPMLFMGLFVAILLFLPRSQGEGVRLERTSSIEARVGNYRETLQIFRQYPVMGVGMNNLCNFRVKMSGQNERSHSCGGSDSSLLYILATTGVVGFFVFSNLVLGFFRNISPDYYGNLTKICVISLGIHSIFANSLFYPWVMGFALLLLAASVRE
jgi:O-antigen ligase